MKSFGCIIYNPDNVPLHKTDLENCYRDNQHGLGIYVWDKKENKSIVKKFAPNTPFEYIWPAIEEYNKDAARYINLAINMRYATTGIKTKTHTQPIAVFEEQMWIMHHGTYLGFEWKPEFMSDTQCMALWLQNFLLQNDITSLEQLMKNQMIIDLIEDKFGGNRILFLEKDKGLITKKDLWFPDVDGVYWSQPL